MLSRRYIEDVDVEVQCEGMIRMDKIKTKILSVKSSNRPTVVLTHRFNMPMSPWNHSGSRSS